MVLLWIVLAAMLLAGIGLVCVPIYRQENRVGARAILAAVAVVATSGTLYSLLGSPNAQSGAGAVPSVADMVAALDARLQQNPDDVAGWKMLGRSYVQLQDYERAVAAYEQALEREGSENAQTYADLGEAVLLQQGGQIGGRAAAFFEAALAAVPNNPKALFYGGIAAVERGDAALAAARWEALLAQSPPANVQAILRERIDEWRGAAGRAPPAAGADGASVAELPIGITVSAQAAASLPATATVFVIARDPAQPSPPVAVARRKLSELADRVTLTDADAMIPGRTLGQFEELEIVVRASPSGEPLAGPGDWSGSRRITLPLAEPIQLTIDTPVN